jgi:hypothetical protein
MVRKTMAEFVQRDGSQESFLPPRSARGRSSYFNLLSLVSIVAALAGCTPVGMAPEGKKNDPPRGEATAAQRAKAHQRLAEGKFPILADFEDSSSGTSGPQQVGLFSIEQEGRKTQFPPAASTDSATSTPASVPSGKPLVSVDQRQFIANMGPTGGGVMEVTLAPESELVFAVPEPGDFSQYSLLSVALYSESLRDDLQVTLTSDASSWFSPSTLVRPGWNTVKLDIRRLAAQPFFDAKKVRQVRLAFTNAGGPIIFRLDDLTLIQNHLELPDAPAGLSIIQDGLDYSLLLPGREEKISISRGDDGLWRLGKDQPIVQLGRNGYGLTDKGEHLEPMGKRRLGELELLECNAVRIRLANTWYFPDRKGEWISQTVRQIRWEYTFYGDGRWITGVGINNPSGGEIGDLRILLPWTVGWSDGKSSDNIRIDGVASSAIRLSYISVFPNDRLDRTLADYAYPARIEVSSAGQPPSGEDGKAFFDASQGCYVVPGTGRCRFVFQPGRTAPTNPVFRITGSWRESVTVNAAGLVLSSRQGEAGTASKPTLAPSPRWEETRRVVLLSDGSALFVVPGQVSSPLPVEVIRHRSARTARCDWRMKKNFGPRDLLTSSCRKYGYQAFLPINLGRPDPKRLHRIEVAYLTEPFFVKDV